MRLGPTLSRLPDTIRSRLEQQPQVAERLARGLTLEETLSDPGWAEDWLRRTDRTTRGVLGFLLRRFAGIPFEQERLEAAAWSQGPWTGAEIRVALARLRQAGVVFAVRKSWGDRLYYVPTDTVPLWQRLLLPVAARPLGGAEAAAVQLAPAPYRLPLALALLSAWADLRRGGGLPLTARGAPNKAAAARLAAGMQLTEGELAALKLTGEGGSLPAPVALALDLGLALGVLKRLPDRIAVDEAAMERWLSLPRPQAERELLRLAIERYACEEPALHLAACSLLPLEASGWYREADFDRAFAAEEALDGWLSLLASFGWIDRGQWRGEPVFRWNWPEPGEGFYIVQPDLEIIVPPDVGLTRRWQLEQVAERVGADAVFLYRLTKERCARACDEGIGLDALKERLEQGSGAPLPAEAEQTLRDWYGGLGRLYFAPATLLRTDSGEVADRLLQNPEISGKLGERLGERDFLVHAADVKPLAALLASYGYPPAAGPAEAPAPAGQARQAAGPAGEGALCGGPDRNLQPSGWVRRGPALSLYEPDRCFPEAEELFPGLKDVPPAWMNRPARYHPSTQRRLIERAIAWRTAIRLRRDGRTITFVPLAIEPADDGFLVRGRPQEEPGAGSLRLPADPEDGLAIVLPIGGPEETP